MKNYLIIVLAFIIAQAVGVCDSTTLLHRPSSSQFKWPLNTFPAFYAWLNKPWVGDDTPYAALRSQVEQAQRAGRLGLFGSFAVDAIDKQMHLRNAASVASSF